MDWRRQHSWEMTKSASSSLQFAFASACQNNLHIREEIYLAAIHKSRVHERCEENVEEIGEGCVSPRALYSALQQAL